MEQWTRFFYQPVLPLGKENRRVTGSREHIALSRRAASEGMVLVKNENEILPLKKGAKVALFGKGSVDYVKGGGGSGDVTVEYVRNLVDGMKEKEAEGKVQVFSPLGEFYKKEMELLYSYGCPPGLTHEPVLPEELLEEAAAFADVAVISFCRFSGESWDRTTENRSTKEFRDVDHRMLDRAAEVFEHGDFYLSEEEKRLVQNVKKAFEQVIVVLNVGGVVDVSWFAKDPEIQCALMAWQGGMEGALAIADILCGDSTPSGKLADTFAERLEDYPSTATFHDSQLYVDYLEDIYVGYRYFETVSGKAEKVVYPFGYGLSYTEFRIEMTSAEVLNDSVIICTDVTNTGSYAGKEVVQLYISAPQGKMGKPARELKAFAKTEHLLPGEVQSLRLEVPIASMVSYDDLGKIQKSAYLLEKGLYQFYLGNNVRDAEKIDFEYFVQEDRIVEQLSQKCAPNTLKERMRSDGSMEMLEQHPEKVSISHWTYPTKTEYLAKEVPEQIRKLLWDDSQTEGIIKLSDVASGKRTLDEFMEQLSLDDKIGLLGGQPNVGVANTYGFGNYPKYGIPNIMSADGPAGLRILPECGVTTTAFPCATLLACTWNTELAAETGAAGASEVLENNIGVWLTPAMNIHRSPLCGRNFEYYSEDPLVAGKMGAAMIKGIQSVGVAAAPKHFACNNKETNRRECESRVSERALREIYLKGFEIAVKESDPWSIMTSYNPVNGRRSAEHRELLTDILRGEWGFQGLVMTDWWNDGDQPLEIKAGNDVKMGVGYPYRVKEAWEQGMITENEIHISAKRLLEMLLKIN